MDRSWVGTSDWTSVSDSAWNTVRLPMSIFPEVAVSSPAMQRRLVVFPQPEGPTREKNSFSPMLNDTPSTAVKSPNTFLSCSTATDSDTDSSYTLISSPDSHWVIRYMMMIIGRMPTA